MKTELKVKNASRIVTMGGCPKYAQSTCGIMYRQA